MDNTYVTRMENGINDKTVLLQFINWDLPIIDVGCSTGALTFELATEAYKRRTKVVSLEPDESTFQQLKKNVETFDNVTPLQQTLEDYIIGTTWPCNIVLSSVIHHMIQHRIQASHLFHKMFRQLPTGSRVIIRDGVRPSSNRCEEEIGLVCSPSSLELAKEFFQRWYEWHHEDKEYTIEGCTVWAPRWLLVEMMLTITWGKASMERECYEHYTILAVEDYLELFEQMEYETLYAESIIQPGYYEFLPKLGRLINRKGYEIPLPFTNQVLCFEKR